MKRTIIYKEANKNMNYYPWDTSVPGPGDFAGQTKKDYTSNKVYSDNALKYILTENGYIEKVGAAYYRYYYLTDHLGNNRIVMDTAGTVRQATNYYPSGVTIAESPARSDQYAQPYKFGGKELDRIKGLDFYDFVARPYDPTLMRFTAPDPMAVKYYSVSPYAYCANNPVNLVDPTGMIWDKASIEEANNLKVSLNGQITDLNRQIEKYQKEIDSGTLNDADVEANKKEITAFGERVSNIKKSVEDIDRLGNDQKHTFVLNSSTNTKMGYVEKGRNGKINIIGNGGDLTVHEITHIRQSLDAGKLIFDSKTNKLGYSGIGVKIQANAEVEAYQKQFSVRRTDLQSGLDLRSPNEITPQIIGNIRRSNGVLVYPAIYNRYVRNQRH